MRIKVKCFEPKAGKENQLLATLGNVTVCLFNWSAEPSRKWMHSACETLHAIFLWVSSLLCVVLKIAAVVQRVREPQTLRSPSTFWNVHFLWSAGERELWIQNKGLALPVSQPCSAFHSCLQQGISFPWYLSYLGNNCASMVGRTLNLAIACNLPSTCEVL